MRNKIRVAVAATAVCALTIGTAAPAVAQEEPEALGFAVDKTQAQPGTLVLGKADAADVAEHCVTDLQEFRTRFQELLAGPFDGVSTTSELFQRFFPDFDPNDPAVIKNLDQLAFVFVALVVLGIGSNIGGAAEDALPQTFVMTFADIATQDPVGERGNFDPDTGEGSVVVPDITPGNWAVAAACVGPTFDLDALESGIRAGGVFLEELGVPVVSDLTDPALQEFVDEFFGEPGHSGLELLAVIGPDLLEPIMVPDAFGAVIFCILDDQGNCPGPPPPPPELDEDDFEEPPPAPPVVAQPSFTG